MTPSCRQENCTVGETGVCLLNNPPASCPNRIGAGASTRVDPPLEEPSRNPTFPRSLTLSTAQTAKVMSEQYCRVVAILGSPNAGKTAALVSLYLMIARGTLSGFKYADSFSIMAFDQMSQGARRWNEGQLPSQLTVHTELGDTRSAGFLHLRLAVSDRSSATDLLFTDLPGEWTDELVDHGRVERLNFLQRADVVWLMIDGRQLLAAETRMWALHRARLLMQRLAPILGRDTPVFIVVSRRDVGEQPTATVEALLKDARALGLSVSVTAIASFSEAGNIIPGFGIAELVSSSVSATNTRPDFWPDEPVDPQAKRAMMRARC
jgi:hypothetical protein